MHSSQFGITFTDSRGPVNSDGPIHCIRSLNRMVRYSVMPLPECHGFVNPCGPRARVHTGAGGIYNGFKSLKLNLVMIASMYACWDRLSVRLTRSLVILMPRSQFAAPELVSLYFTFISCLSSLMSETLLPVTIPSST